MGTGHQKHKQRRQRRHVKKFMDGLKSPEEVHAQYAFPTNAKCQGCNTRRPTIRAIVMYPLRDAMREIEGLAVLAQTHPQQVTSIMVQLKGSDGKPAAYIRTGMAYSCTSCGPTLERTLAKNLPSYAVVEINRGPSNPKVISA